MPDQRRIAPLASAASHSGGHATLSLDKHTYREFVDQLQALPQTWIDEGPGSDAAGTDWWRRAGAAVWTTLVIVTVVRVAFAAWRVLAAFFAGTHAAPSPPFAVNILLFGLSGVLLLCGGPRDRSVRHLGTFFLFIAATFAVSLPPVAGDIHDSLGERVLVQLGRLPMDAFLPVSLWLFVREFPTPSRLARARRVANAFLAAAAGIGALLFVANLWPVVEPAAPQPAWAEALRYLLARSRPALVYWPLLFTITSLAIPYLVWKLRFETVDARQRGTVLLVPLALAVTPMLAAVILTPFVPALRDPANRVAIGWVLYGALISLIPTTAYAVIVKRVLDVQFALRKTSQHALARYAVWLASVGPLTYLFVEIYLSRGAATLEPWQHPMLVFVLPLLGFGVLVFRDQLLRGVDRWFLRGPVDYAEALSRIDKGRREARGIREMARLLSAEIERALHPQTITIYVLDAAGDRPVAMEGPGAPLHAESMLIDLLRQMRCDLQIAATMDDQVARLLSPADRAWLTETRTTLLCPLIDSTERLLGLIAMGQSRGGLPYTKQDRMFLMAISGHAASQLESRWLQESADEAHDDRPRLHTAATIDWDNEPGAQCPTCGLVWPGNVRDCSCGTPTGPAALPFVVRGTFRVERLIGAGGMGVVYQAVDVTLDRKVAIKTLPDVTPDRVARLQREARTMAAVRHPNLALIYGIEQWRGVPLLIVEYLEGGMLSTHLRHGPLSVLKTIALGVVLGDVLDRIHLSGVLHRDLKPSNIAYSPEGAIKLLDFGVAAIINRSMSDDEPPRRTAADTQIPADVMDQLSPLQTFADSTHRLVGTPLYLSPEALAGEPPDPSFDLWSLSLVLYEALAAHHPLSAGRAADLADRIRQTRIPDVRMFRPDCPPAFAALLRSCLSPRIGDRPATAKALGARLERLREELNAAGD